MIAKPIYWSIGAFQMIKTCLFYVQECVLFVLGPVQQIAFSYGNLEMSNISAAAILVTGILSIVFFIIASLKTDTKGLIESSIEHPDKNK